jgi:cystathionine gamma-synthase/O-succinylhomoserine sulfhydrylase
LFIRELAVPSDRRTSCRQCTAAGCAALCNACELIDISNNFGDAKSLICHPATTTHHNMGPEGRAEAGVEDGMLRLNVGLEDPLDLIEDLDRALSSAGV